MIILMNRHPSRVNGFGYKVTKFFDKAFNNLTIYFALLPKNMVFQFFFDMHYYDFEGGENCPSVTGNGGSHTNTHRPKFCIFTAFRW